MRLPYAQHCIKPTAPVARANEGETSFGRSKETKDLAAGTGHTQATMRPFLKCTAPRKSTAGASWPERIAVLRREKVVRRALSAPQRAPRLSA